MAPRSTSRSTSERATDDASGGEPSLVVGVITAPHGVRGEVRVDPRSDVPDRFRVGAVLRCDGVGPLRIASLRGTPTAPVLGFRGYTSRPAAEPLRGRSLRVSLSEARRATQGSYLWADLVGLRAETPDGAPLGVVRELIRAGEADVLVLARPEGGELLVPAIASVVRAVDLAAGRIVVAPQEEL